MASKQARDLRAGDVVTLRTWTRTERATVKTRTVSHVITEGTRNLVIVWQDGTHTTIDRSQHVTVTHATMMGGAL